MKLLCMYSPSTGFSTCTFLPGSTQPFNNDKTREVNVVNRLTTTFFDSLLGGREGITGEVCLLLCHVNRKVTNEGWTGKDTKRDLY